MNCYEKYNWIIIIFFLGGGLKRNSIRYSVNKLENLHKTNARNKKRTWNQPQILMLGIEKLKI